MSKDVENLRKHERVLNHVDIIKDKLEHKNKIKVGLLEFHPYDCCPLSCLYCTYHRDKSEVFPFNSMEKLKVFDPRAIVVSGGGEPVYYNDGKYKFNDVIHKLREMFPDAKIGVTSNGQYMPEGDWQKEVEWIRVSLDTDNEKTFKKIKDGSLEKSLETLKQLIQGPIKYVGAGFVYSRFNIDEVYNFLKMIYRDVYLEYKLEYTYQQILSYQAEQVNNKSKHHNINSQVAKSMNKSNNLLDFDSILQNKSGI